MESYADVIPFNSGLTEGDIAHWILHSTRKSRRYIHFVCMMCTQVI
jgi:hypothetical protein